MLRAHVLNVVAYAALRFESPIGAKRLVTRMARVLRAPTVDAETARGLMRSLLPLGTCLSRSMAVASLMRDAQVVIGVRAGVDGHERDTQETTIAQSVYAHAWVECDGAPLVPSDVVGTEIARM